MKKNIVGITGFFLNKESKKDNRTKQRKIKRTERWGKRQNRKKEYRVKQTNKQTKEQKDSKKNKTKRLKIF